ncbi:T4SS efffector SepA family protein [Calothrix sp. PCC 6303]|uniref:T4SS efffector SepA family protein n=1 Tax=Calothrix sp. PCC 6303 TaxID=1170562 RepID=UPI0039EF233A
MISKFFASIFSTGTLERVLSYYEIHHKSQVSDEKSVDPGKEIIDLGNLNSLDKSLDHTRVMRAIMGDNEVQKPNWSKIIDVAHELVVQRGMTIDDLIKLSLSNIVKGKKTDSGFHYLPELNISIQGVSANLAWRNALHLMESTKLPIEIYFEWRDKKDSMHPGKRGKVSWCPE